RGSRQIAGALQKKIVAVAVGIGAVRKTERASMRSVGRWWRTWPAAAAAAAGRRHTATAFARTGICVIPLGRPWIHETAIVQAIGDKTVRVAEHHRPGARRKHRAAEPLVRRRIALIARGRDRPIAHSRVDGVRLRQRAVEADARAK